MRKLYPLLCGLMFFLSACGSSSPGSSEEAGISGQLLSASGSPVSGVSVYLYDDASTSQVGASHLMSDTTDTSGHYSFSGMDSGTYRIEARSESGYSAIISDISLSSDEDLELEAQTTRFSGSISGTVTLDGESDYEGIDVFIPGTSFHAVTDSDGEYTLTKVPSGYYTVYAVKHGFLPETSPTVSVTAGGTVDADDLSLDDDPDLPREGSDGSDGSDGSAATEWYFGNGAPDDSDGSNGDLYIDLDSKDIYLKDSGTWGSPVGNFPGSDGDDAELPDPSLPAVVVSLTSMSLTEGGASDNFTVALNAEPIEDVTIDLDLSESNQVTLSVTQLVFSPSNYADTQTVYVSALDDGSGEGSHSVTINFTVTSYDGYHGIGVYPVEITISED